MRILSKRINGRNGDGSIQLQADEPEDMYHLFNLICKGDLVLATTVRNVVKESNTGSTSKSRIKVNTASCNIFVNTPLLLVLHEGLILISSRTTILILIDDIENTS